MYMEVYSAVTYLGVHVLVDLCPVEHGSIVLVDVDSSHLLKSKYSFNLNVPMLPSFVHVLGHIKLSLTAICTWISCTFVNLT